MLSLPFKLLTYCIEKEQLTASTSPLKPHANVKNILITGCGSFCCTMFQAPAHWQNPLWKWKLGFDFSPHGQACMETSTVSSGRRGRNLQRRLTRWEIENCDVAVPSFLPFSATTATVTRFRRPHQCSTRSCFFRRRRRVCQMTARC